VQVKLLRLSQEVRYAGIHIVLCTRRSSAEVLPTDIRINTVLAGKFNTGRMIVGGAYGPDLQVQTPYINFAMMDEWIPTCRDHILSK